MPAITASNGMSLFDSHCHVQFAAFSADWEAVIDRALKGNVWLINVGTQKDTSRKAVEIANQYPQGVYAAVGLHPIHLEKTFHDEQELGGPAVETAKGFISRGEEFDYEYYKSLASDPKVVAIGEIGLDYYRTPEKERQEKQKDVFRQFLKLAAVAKKPVIIHCRDAAPNFSVENLGGQAYDDMIQILHTTNYILQTGGVIHSFTGDFNLAGKFLDLGLYLGLNGIITFTDEYDDVVANVPLDRILIETDAPYLAPVPHRGKRNEPLYVEFVARRIAEIKKISFEEVVEKTNKNTRKLFKLE